MKKGAEKVQGKVEPVVRAGVEPILKAKLKVKDKIRGGRFYSMFVILFIYHLMNRLLKLINLCSVVNKEAIKKLII